MIHRTSPPPTDDQRRQAAAAALAHAEQVKGTDPDRAAALRVLARKWLEPLDLRALIR